MSSSVIARAQSYRSSRVVVVSTSGGGSFAASSSGKGTLHTSMVFPNMPAPENGGAVKLCGTKAAG